MRANTVRCAIKAVTFIDAAPKVLQLILIKLTLYLLWKNTYLLVTQLSRTQK